MYNPVKKLKTKSSTEAKLVRVYYVLTHVIQTRYFLKDQGYQICDNVIYQDNQSTIKLENNVRRSSRNWTRHINVKIIILSLIESLMRSNMWIFVPLQTRSEIISRKHCRDLNFVSLGISLLVSMKIKFPPIMCLE